MLEKMGVSFSVYVTTTDESRKEGEAPEDLVTRLARDKAKMAYTDLAKDNVAILAADTIVVQGDFVYGKPTNLEHAQQIWHSLSANKHQVMTAVCLFHDGRTSVKLGITEVEFGRVTAEQMERYWLTGEPLDKAGAYAIQGYASAWVKSIHGSYSNVVGLPLREVNELLVTIDRNWL
ncbi:MAG: septum formation protein [Arenicella sp.]|jgi:septum formation protein